MYRIGQINYITPAGLKLVTQLSVNQHIIENRDEVIEMLDRHHKQLLEGMSKINDVWSSLSKPGNENKSVHQAVPVLNTQGNISTNESGNSVVKFQIRSDNENNDTESMIRSDQIHSDSALVLRRAVFEQNQLERKDLLSFAVNQHEFEIKKHEFETKKHDFETKKHDFETKKHEFETKKHEFEIKKRELKRHQDKEDLQFELEKRKLLSQADHEFEFKKGKLDESGKASPRRTASNIVDPYRTETDSDCL